MTNGVHLSPMGFLQTVAFWACDFLASCLLAS